MPFFLSFLRKYEPRKTLGFLVFEELTGTSLQRQIPALVTFLVIAFHLFASEINNL